VSPLDYFYSGTCAVALVVLLRLHARSGAWTIPAQDMKLRLLRRDLDIVHAKTDAIVRENVHFQREQNESKEALLREIRSVGSQVGLLLAMRDELSEMKDQTAKLEQDLTSLVCFEDAQARKAALPGFCPLRKIPCPIEEKSE